MTLAIAWKPITDPLDIKRLAKLVEELGELTNIVGRIMQQGIDGIDPKSNIDNRDRLEQEIADVEANISLCINHFRLNDSAINQRASIKIQEQQFWGRDV